MATNNIFPTDDKSQNKSLKIIRLAKVCYCRKKRLFFKAIKEIDTFITQKRNKSFIIAFFIWCIFRKKIAKVFILISPSIKDGHITLWIYIPICIIIAWLITHKWKKRYIYSNNQIWITVLAIPVYLIYRLTENSWHFSRFSSVYDNQLQFAYSDIIIITSIAIIVESYLVKINIKNAIKKQQENKKDNIIPENPIINDKDDKLNRLPIAESLAEKLIKIPLTQAFAVGITGKWGEGKTSFFNLLNKQLKEQDKNGIIIEFTPWQCSHEKDITTHFLDSLYDALKPYSGELASNIRGYAKSLISISGGTYKEILNLGLNLISDDTKSYQARKTKVEKCIKSLNRRIYIFFDDLDRLYPKEIIECLRIIRNTANFPNTLYIVAYDRDYVQTAINKELEKNSVGYTEKIFQINYALPTADKKDLERYLYSKIKNLEIDQEKLEIIFPKKLVKEENSFKITNYIESIRDSNRLLNLIYLSIHFDNDNFNLDKHSIVLIAVLKMKYEKFTKYLVNNFNDTVKIRDSKPYKFSMPVSNSNEYETDEFTIELLSTIFNSNTRIANKKIFQFYYNSIAPNKYLEKNFIDPHLDNIHQLVKHLDSIIDRDDLNYFCWTLLLYRNKKSQLVILKGLLYLENKKDIKERHIVRYLMENNKRDIQNILKTLFDSLVESEINYYSLFAIHSIITDSRIEALITTKISKYEEIIFFWQAARDLDGNELREETIDLFNKILNNIKDLNSHSNLLYCIKELVRIFPTEFLNYIYKLNKNFKIESYETINKETEQDDGDPEWEDSFNLFLYMDQIIEDDLIKFTESQKLAFYDTDENYDEYYAVINSFMLNPPNKRKEELINRFNLSIE